MRRYAGGQFLITPSGLAGVSVGNYGLLSSNANISVVGAGAPTDNTGEQQMHNCPDLFRVIGFYGFAAVWTSVVRGAQRLKV